LLTGFKTQGARSLMIAFLNIFANKNHPDKKPELIVIDLDKR